MSARRQPVNAPRDGDADGDGDGGSVSSGSDVDDEENDDDRDEFREGKEPMSPKLYQNVCKWLLEWGNLDGIFSALYIVLTWNLSCRGNNTSKIQLSHLKWTVFDALQVNFKHTKVDQRGDTKCKKRHLFRTCLNTTSICLFCWVSTLPAALPLCRPEGDNFSPGVARAKPKGLAQFCKKC
jgi:hypothetical protein